MAIVNASNLKTTHVLTAAAAFSDPSGSLPWVDDEDDELGMSSKKKEDEERESGWSYVRTSWVYNCCYAYPWKPVIPVFMMMSKVQIKR